VNHPITARRVWVRVVVALTAIGILSFGGLPPFMDTAEAAVKVTGGKRCDEMFGLSGTPTDPGAVPWANGDSIRPEADWDSYEYENPRMALNGLTLPEDPAEQQAFLKQFDKPYKEYAEGTPERVYARYKLYLRDHPGSANRYGSFQNWLNEAYIKPYGNNMRGRAYHKHVVKSLGLIGPDWLCEVTITVTDENGNVISERRVDIYNQRTRRFIETKSGNTYPIEQAKKDQAMRQRGQLGRGTLILGQEPNNETLRNVARVREGSGPGFDVYQHRSTGLVRAQDLKGPNSAPGDTRTNIGRSSEVIRQSPPTPETMRQQLARARANDPMGLRVRGPGGVDFSTLELRYVGTPVAGQGLDYSFSADMVDESEGLGYGGQEKAQLVSDSLFTWLALSPDKFWVNLNPDEPDRVIDASFGATDTGRVLLQADLEMKHDYATAMDPRTGIGKELRDKLDAENIPCTHGVRNWIVPEPAEVREQDGGIYILDAPLKVNSVPQDFSTPNPNGTCTLTQAQHERVQELLNTMIVPDIEKKVNTDPRYADLRRVYTSRVAAEWIRLQDTEQPTDYHSIINSNNVADWPLRGQNVSWTPQQTYQEYLKSFTEGDYSYPCQVEGRNATCVMGGVDFSKAPKENIDQARFTTEHTYLPRTTEISVRAMTEDAENKGLLALGSSTATSESDTGPEPPVVPEPPVDADSPAFTG
jgi:hypothetical protein